MGQASTGKLKSLLKRSPMPAETWSPEHPWFKDASNLHAMREDVPKTPEEVELYTMWKSGRNFEIWEPKGRCTWCPECERDNMFIHSGDYICQWCRNA